MAICLNHSEPPSTSNNTLDISRMVWDRHFLRGGTAPAISMSNVSSPGCHLDVHLQQRSDRRIHCRCPELLRVHFPKTLVALHFGLFTKALIASSRSASLYTHDLLTRLDTIKGRLSDIDASIENQLLKSALKKKVTKVRMCAPSTSASVMMMMR